MGGERLCALCVYVRCVGGTEVVCIVCVGRGVVCIVYVIVIDWLTSNYGL